MTKTNEVTSNIELPRGQSFNDYLSRLMEEDREQSESGVYYCPPVLDKAELGIRLWRFDRSSRRYYYEPDQNVFFPSQTSVQDATMKTSPFIMEWIDSMGGLDNARAYRDERAFYGTLMHILFTETLHLGEIDLSQIPTIVQMYRSIHELWHIDTRKWIPELKADLSAFAQWVHDHNVEPIAIEIPVTYPITPHMDFLIQKKSDAILWLAGTIDLVARADIKRKGHWGEEYKSGPRKGEPKETYKIVRERIVVDYKSGKKGFYKGNEVQVDTYLYGWNHVCHRNKIDMVGQSCWNFAPKDSTGSEPTYTFAEQTEKEMRKYMPHLTQIFKLDGYHEVSDVREVEGIVRIGESALDNVSLISASDYMKKSYQSHVGND